LSCFFVFDFFFPRSPTPFPQVNADEGTILSVTGCNNDTDIVNGLISLNQSSYVVLEDDIDALLRSYPDDPSLGIPLNTGAGELSTGSQDKRSNSLFNDAIEHSPRRWITGLLADAGNPVYSYHFQQVPYGNTISVGGAFFPFPHCLFARLTCLASSRTATHATEVRSPVPSVLATRF
jgi:hypothetical protein